MDKTRTRTVKLPIYPITLSECTKAGVIVVLELIECIRGVQGRESGTIV